MPDKTPTQRLLDSALFIAVITAVCYVLGFLAHMRTGWTYGIPWHLLPDPPLHQTLVFGGIYLLIYAAIGLFVILLYLYLERRIARIKVVRTYFEDRFAKHRFVFSTFLVVISSTILFLVPLYLESPFGRGILQSKTLPKVIELKATNNAAPKDPTSWHYISHKDGLIILGNTSEKRYALINEDEVQSLVIEIPK